MLYNPKNKGDVSKAIERFKYFLKNNKVFELKAKQTPKTYPQLKYTPLIIKWFALEYGETMEYIKLEFFKKKANKELFEFERANRKTGEIRLEYRSLAVLKKDELTIAINRFRDYASKEAGIYLPEPNDLPYLREIEIQVENNKQFI